MEKFPVLNLIVRHGAVGSAVLGFAAAAIVGAALIQSLAWLAVPAGLFAGGIVYFFAKSYVELVLLITDMLLPR